MRLGLDIGSNSIGWALFALNDRREPNHLISGGTRIFPDGRNPKDKSSNARKRREKRGPRRNRDRRLRRGRRLLTALCDLGLLPEAGAARDAAFAADPYRLRAEGLDRPLSPAELARALWSLNAGRGFQSNRKTDKAEDKGQLKRDISELRARMAQSGARSLGEYLWRRHKKGKTLRARLGNGLYPERAMLREEFDALRRAQAPHHALAPEDWTQIAGIIFHQRPLRSPPVGHCTLIPTEDRAMKASPLFQRYRILNELTNLRLRPFGQAERALTGAELEKLYLLLLSKKEQEIEKIPALLDLPPNTRVNLAGLKRDKIQGDLTAACLAAGKRFGKAWRALPLGRQREVVGRLLQEQDEDALVHWLASEFGLSQEAAEATIDAPLPPGTGALSEKALQLLVPIMKDQGLSYHEAVAEAGLRHHSDHRLAGAMPRLPYYGAVLDRHVLGTRETPRDEVEFYGRIGNPTVHIGLNELRRLVNEVIERYGKPDEIVVELARDLKRSAEAKREAEREQRRHQDTNERLKAEMEEAGVPFSPHILRKLKIWEEQGKVGERVCPFTGTPLSFERAVGEETEIEHILPFSRTLDDGMMNKVLSMKSANQEKGKRTPYEAWGHDPVRYQAILARAEAMPRKAWRYLPDAMEKFEEKSDFIGRQLNETRYLSRLAREYLNAILPLEKIWVVPGQMTAMLRGKWGLTGILSDANRKERTDHRHHMIDAIVVGLTSRSMLQRLARAAATSDQRLIDDMPEPWSGYFPEIRDTVLASVVAHKPDHGTPGLAGTTSGSLHNDTAYGPVSGPDDKDIYTVVVRKALADMKAKDLEDVRDPALRRKLIALYDESASGEGSEKERWLGFVARAWKELGIRRVRLLQREGNLIFVRDSEGRPYKAYKADGNAWMDVWLLPSGKVRGETVTRFDANQKCFSSAVKREYPTARKLMRLQINDMVALGEGDQRRILRVQKLSGQKITMVEHNEGGNLRERQETKDPELLYKPLTKSAGKVLREGLRRITVTPGGRVLDAGPLEPDGRRKPKHGEEPR